MHILATIEQGTQEKTFYSLVLKVLTDRGSNVWGAYQKFDIPLLDTYICPNCKCETVATKKKKCIRCEYRFPAKEFVSAMLIFGVASIAIGLWMSYLFVFPFIRDPRILDIGSQTELQTVAHNTDGAMYRIERKGIPYKTVFQTKRTRTKRGITTTTSTFYSLVTMGSRQPLVVAHTAIGTHDTDSEWLGRFEKRDRESVPKELMVELDRNKIRLADVYFSSGSGILELGLAPFFGLFFFVVGIGMTISGMLLLKKNRIYKSDLIRAGFQRVSR